MLSQTAEHALRAVLFLARWGREEPVSADRVAEALGAPRNYLGKTLHALTKAGMVEGVRGPAGGYRLLLDPERLSVASLIAAVDEPERRKVCLLGDQPCDDTNPCRAHQRWTALEQGTRDLLRQTTLADLLGEPAHAAAAHPIDDQSPENARSI